MNSEDLNETLENNNVHLSIESADILNTIEDRGVEIHELDNEEIGSDFNGNKPINSS